MATGGKRTRRLVVVGIGALLAAAATVLAIFLAPRHRSAQLVDLVTGIIWPIVILVGVTVFWPEVRSVMAEVGDRVRRGSSFGLGPITLGELPAQADRIPSPATGESVTVDNIALLHTSFLRPDKTRDFGDGRLYYQFEVIVIAPEAVMDRIESVTYHLDAAWPRDKRVQTTTDRAARFKLKELANGTSIVTADVTFKTANDQGVRLNRFIDLRADGPRL